MGATERGRRPLLSRTAWIFNGGIEPMRFAAPLSSLTLAVLIATSGCGKARVQPETASDLVDAAQYLPNAAPGTLIQTRLTGAMHAFHEANRRWPSDFS